VAALHLRLKTTPAALLPASSDELGARSDHVAADDLYSSLLPAAAAYRANLAAAKAAKAAPVPAPAAN
jgi:hypothetical protein